ncbi:class I SAM-dependent methyltransferase [Streptomyces alkaliterrae]|uniref:Class I SAM-dependent methyltransferase n=2 Tax=Streptomyces alkaliterrae TaxID=2213162 RepID=A0A5P0YS51_9ACTN|nr:class I SAM-dependent methyltransferase [Streptomyces alkaliterrae]MBB1260853.1 class I SAM-dependent methyltransferase [Streptomyces alkaliterrae]MQS02710.1 class I SAM-dependent methyltransferase [Streptomyces alkaliterrae]
MARHRITQGGVEETVLIPLYARAVETAGPDPALRDPRAAEMVDGIEYDYRKFDGQPSLKGAVMRTVLFDLWTRDFLAEHPDGTVIEVGTGLNTRFERTDNGRASWYDLDLPAVIALRREFFEDTPRRTMIAASVTDPSWPDRVTGDGPRLISAEAVLAFLPEEDVRGVVGLLADRFPGAFLATDTSGPSIVRSQQNHDVLSRVDARMRWSCADPAEVTDWHPGTELLASHTMTSLPPRLVEGLPRAYRDMIDELAVLRLPQVEQYRMNLYRLP